MTILYVNPAGVSGPILAVLERSGYEMISVATPSEALKKIRTRHFSAMLIEECIQDANAFEFISKVHRAQPELLVFQMRVWRSELPEILELLQTVEEGFMHLNPEEYEANADFEIAPGTVASASPRSLSGSASPLPKIIPA